MNGESEHENGFEERVESRFDQTSSQHGSTPNIESDATMIGSGHNSVDGKESAEAEVRPPLENGVGEEAPSAKVETE